MLFSNLRSSLSGLAALSLLTLLSAGAAQAQVEGGSLFVAQTGEVFATYQGTTASYTDDLYLDSPANSLGLLFVNQTSPVGSTVDLGSFTAGTELIFRMHVDNTGDDFFTGPASRNPDNHAHALVTYNYTPTETLVQFEDLLGGPYNYNDLGFTFTNVAQTSVPEPGSCALLTGLAVSGGIFLRRRARRS